MATIMKRSGRWFVQVRRKGYPSQSKTFSAKADAKAWANEQESRIEQGQMPSGIRVLRSTTLGDILGRYVEEITPKKRSSHTEALRLAKIQREPMCDLALSELTSTPIAEYRDRRLASVSKATVVRELSLIHNALEVARKEWGYRLPENPVALVTKPRISNARNRRLQEGDWDRLEQALLTTRNAYIRPIVRFAIETGMRRGEILKLRWRHVDLAKRTAHIPETKTDRPRTIPLTDGSIAILEGLARGDDDLVFPVTMDAFKLAWRRVLRRAALPDLHFHDLRHEAISRFFEIGLSMPEVAVISGHRDPRMLFRYTHLRPTDLAEKLRGVTWGEQTAAKVSEKGAASA